MESKIYKLEDISSISSKQVLEMYSSHINPVLMNIFNILGLEDLDVDHASGMYLYLKSGKKILDMTSGLGVSALGHNHPVVIKAERFCHENNVVDMQKLGPNRIQAVLAHNLSCLMPGDLNMVTFSVSGAEANEAAIKLATKVQSKKNKKFFIRFEGAYHGKTHGALSLTDSENFREGFLIGIPEENILTAPFGDIESLKNIVHNHTFSNDMSDIIGIFVEPMGGQDIQIPPDGFLAELCKICNKYNILTIFDEIKVGLGRSGNGNLFYFQKEDVTPDIVTISKALGGGKRAIGAMVTTTKLFKSAYGNRDTCALHSSTFGGIGESCAVAIETLNYISNQSFLNSVKDKSSYFKSRLISLQNNHPKYIKSIKGEGLFLGIEFDFGWLSTFADISNNQKISKMVNGLGIAAIVRELYENHNILTHFSGSTPNVLHLMPPLIIEKKEIDMFITSIKSVVETRFEKTLFNFFSSHIKRLF